MSFDNLQVGDVVQITNDIDEDGNCQGVDYTIPAAAYGCRAEILEVRNCGCYKVELEISNTLTLNTSISPNLIAKTLPGGVTAKNVDLSIGDVAIEQNQDFDMEQINKEEDEPELNPDDLMKSIRKACGRR